MPVCRERGVRIVTNMGAANPMGAAHAMRREAAEGGVRRVAYAAVLGDDVSDIVREHRELPLLEGAPLESILPVMASANAYLGADVVRDALRTGAEVVVTGRVADPSLLLGAALYANDWSYDDLPRMAAATIAGHLLEGSTQVTRDYFADPGKNDVEQLAELPFPYADVTADGQVTIGKLAGSGGRLDRMTCIEQATYEMHDPSRYITPDCERDISRLDFQEESADRVAVGVAARPRTYRLVQAGPGVLRRIHRRRRDHLRATECAGEGATGRRRRTGAVPARRRHRPRVQIDMIVSTNLLGHRDAAARPDPYELRQPIAARCPDQRSADMLSYEVIRLRLAGPCAAGGPVNVGAREVIAVNSVLLARALAEPRVVYLEGAA